MRVSSETDLPKKTRYVASLVTLLTRAAKTPSSTVGSIVKVAAPSSVFNCSSTSVGRTLPKRATTVKAVPRSISMSPGSIANSVRPTTSVGPVTSPVGSRNSCRLISRPQRPAATTPDTRKQNDRKLSVDHANIWRCGTTDFQSDARASLSASSMTHSFRTDGCDWRLDCSSA